MPACRPLSEAEVERVVLSFHGRYGARDRALFTLGVLSGFRISELLSLRVRDVVQDGRLVAYLTVTRRRMKRKARSRTVLLHPQAQQALRTWLLEMAQGIPLPPDTVKTFAMQVHARLGNDLRKTQEALGQQDISSTIRYLQVQQADIDQAVRSLVLGTSTGPLGLVAGPWGRGTGVTNGHTSHGTAHPGN